MRREVKLEVDRTDAEERLGVRLEPFVTYDEAWPEQEGVFPDISWSDDAGVVDVRFETDMRKEVECSVEIGSLIVRLRVIGMDVSPTSA
jgi:hypothetical protein